MFGGIYAGNVLHTPKGLTTLFGLDRPGHRVLALTSKERRRLKLATRDSALSAPLVQIDLTVNSRGNKAAVSILRPRKWPTSSGLRHRLEVDIALASPDDVQRARVEQITAAPAVEAGRGAVLTGIVSATATTYNLQLDSELGPIGVASGHAVWALGLPGWVPVNDLTEGEAVWTLKGPARVESLTRRRKREHVINLEVQAEGCFRVGTTGLLVQGCVVLASGSR